MRRAVAASNAKGRPGPLRRRGGAAAYGEVIDGIEATDFLLKVSGVELGEGHQI